MRQNSSMPCGDSAAAFHNPPVQRPSHRAKRRGVVLFWSMALLGVLMGTAVLVVDWGSVQLAKGELQGAVDAATLYGVGGMEKSAKVARQRVLESLTENRVNGRSIPASAIDVEFGVWDPGFKTFTPLGDDDDGDDDADDDDDGADGDDGDGDDDKDDRELNSATALRVTVRMSGEDGAKSVFGSLFGVSAFNVSARATATRGEPVGVDVDAKASPYLAGMPDGSKIDFTADSLLEWKKDASYAPECSPVQVSIPVVPGQILYFRDIKGSTGDYNSGLTYGLEGNLDRPNMAQDPVNGINTTYAPLNSLMGIFLDDRQPDTWAMRNKLDFSSENSRAFDKLMMETKQIFFIGDGVNNESGKLQKFVVPPGATRLYLGLSDEYGFWWDNFGSYRTTVFYGEVKLVE